MKSCPWGDVKQAQPFLDGVTWITGTEHGGLHLMPHRLAEVPKEVGALFRAGLEWPEIAVEVPIVCALLEIPLPGRVAHPAVVRVEAEALAERFGRYEPAREPLRRLAALVVDVDADRKGKPPRTALAAGWALGWRLWPATDAPPEPDENGQVKMRVGDRYSRPLVEHIRKMGEFHAVFEVGQPLPEGSKEALTELLFPPKGFKAWVRSVRRAREEGRA